MKNSKIQIPLIASGLLLALQSKAAPIVTKDWVFDDLGNVCVAATEQKVNDQTFRFEMSYDKSGLLPVEVWVRDVSGLDKTQSLKLVTEAAPIMTYPVVEFKDASATSLFWQVPMDTESLVSYVKRQTRLSLKATQRDGTIVPVIFSLRGSSATVDALATKCAAGKSLTRTDFEKSFVVAKAVMALDPAKVDTDRSARLRSAYIGGLQALSLKNQMQKELSDLNARYAGLIQELAKVNGSLDQMTQKELTSLQTQKAQLEAKILKLGQDIQTQLGLIKAKETELPAANQAYELAYREYAPHIPEVDRLSANLRSAEASAESRRRSVADLDSSIQQAQQRVRGLDAEIQSLRQQIQSAEYEINNLRNQANEADRVAQRFDARRESRDRYMNHPVVRACQQQYSDRCRSLLNDVQREIDADVDQFARRLMEVSSAIQNELSSRLNLISRLDSDIRSKMNYDMPRAQNELNALVSQKDSADRALRQAQAEVDSARCQLNSFVASIADKKARYESAVSKVNSIKSQLAALEADKVKMENGRSQATTDLARNEAATQALIEKIRQSQGRSSEISKALEPYFADKAMLENAISVADADLVSKKTEFAQEIAR